MRLLGGYWVIILLCLAITIPVTATGWYSNYGNMQPHTVNLSSTNPANLTNYPVMVVIFNSSGTSSSGSMYTNGKTATDWSDIAFVDTTNTTAYDYFIGYTNATSATVWVEIPTISNATDTTLFIYYNASAKTTASNGSAVFPFFDHFGGASIDETTKWSMNNMAAESSWAT